MGSLVITNLVLVRFSSCLLTHRLKLGPNFTIIVLVVVWMPATPGKLSNSLKYSHRKFAAWRKKYNSRSSLMVPATFYRTILDNYVGNSAGIPTGLGTRGCIEDPRVTRTGFIPDPYTGTVFAGPGTGAKRPLWRVWQGDSRGLRVWWFGGRAQPLIEPLCLANVWFAGGSVPVLSRMGFYTVENERRQLGLIIGRVLLFFSFVFVERVFECALVNWLVPVGDTPDPDTGMWVVELERQRGVPTVAIIPVDSIARAAHLIGVYGTGVARGL
ncbi:hypothetical protein B0H14DRAFT_2556982 [Mycena olivaceomarginata]|nr:hypothetical protein B0H14DRAFT_2556982 [Mycena olivaceomarginata]